MDRDRFDFFLLIELLLDDFVLDNEICNINCVINIVVFKRYNGCIFEIYVGDVN